MADPLANQNALFNQYESEYCSKSTDISRKVQALGSFSAGEARVVVLTKLSVVVAHLTSNNLVGADVKRLRIKEIEAELKEADQIVRLAVYTTCSNCICNRS